MAAHLKAADSNSAEGRRLHEVRDSLLNLHKALVDYERVRYEKIIGPVPSPNHFLRLLTSDPWFAWLHPLSQLIVTIDEALEGKEPLTLQSAEALVRQTALLLVPAENADGFAGHYHEALQNEPEVVLAHGAVVKLAGRRKPSG